MAEVAVEGDVLSAVSQAAEGCHILAHCHWVALNLHMVGIGVSGAGGEQGLGPLSPLVSLGS